jgi:hypothetical protein
VVAALIKSCSCLANLLFSSWATSTKSNAS